MVSIVMGALSGRATLLPRGDAKGKVRKIADREGDADTAEAPLPDVLPRLRDAFVYAAASYAAASAAATAAAAAAAAAAVDGGTAAAPAKGREGGKHKKNSPAVAAAAAAAVDYAAWLSKHASQRPAPAPGAPASPGGARPRGRPAFGF
jgi:hypothetical protein